MSALQTLLAPASSSSASSSSCTRRGTSWRPSGRASGSIASRWESETRFRGSPSAGTSTEYAICWLPLGGYVKMATQEEDATSSALEGQVPDDGGSARRLLRGQAGLETDDHHPGRRHHEHAVRLAGVQRAGAQERARVRSRNPRGRCGHGRVDSGPRAACGAGPGRQRHGDQWNAGDPMERHPRRHPVRRLGFDHDRRGRQADGGAGGAP